MLGVRRVGVTTAAGALQRKGLITYHRGEVRVRDRKGLEHAACSCYASDTATYRQHMEVFASVPTAAVAQEATAAAATESPS